MNTAAKAALVATRAVGSWIWTDSQLSFFAQAWAKFLRQARTELQDTFPRRPRWYVSI